jgi:hypothetical protein
MADAMWNDMVGTLRDNGIEFEPGLADPEIEAAEERYGFRFPPDLRAFLQTGLPSGSDFPNWRDGDEAEVPYESANHTSGVCPEIQCGVAPADRVKLDRVSSVF